MRHLGHAVYERVRSLDDARYGTVVYAFPYIDHDGSRCAVLFDGDSEPTWYENSLSIESVPDAPPPTEVDLARSDMLVVQIAWPNLSVVEQVAKLERVAEERVRRTAKRRTRRGRRRPR